MRKNIRFDFMLDRNTYDLLQMLAARRGQSLAEAIRQAIRTAAERN